MPDWSAGCSWRNIRSWTWCRSARRCAACIRPTSGWKSPPCRSSGICSAPWWGVSERRRPEKRGASLSDAPLFSVGAVPCRPLFTGSDGLPGNLLFAALLVAAVHHVVVGDRLAGFPDLDVLLSEAPVGADRELARMVAAAALRAIGRGLRRGAVRLVFVKGL